MKVQVMSDATPLVKIWIVASVLFLFVSLGLKDADWEQALSALGKGSLLASVMIGIHQCRSKNRPEA
jgi:hypothetical protein